MLYCFNFVLVYSSPGLAEKCYVYCRMLCSHSCRSWCLALIGLLMAAAAIAFAVSLGVTYTKWKDADNKVKSLEAELAGNWVN